MQAVVESVRQSGPVDYIDGIFKNFADVIRKSSVSDGDSKNVIQGTTSWIDAFWEF